jgi:hypothetical protein
LKAAKLLHCITGCILRPHAIHFIMSDERDR